MAMAEDSQSSPNAWLGELSPNIKRYQYEQKKKLQEAMNIEYHRLLQRDENASEWLLFEIDEETFSRDFLNLEDKTPWSSFSKRESLLLVKMMTKEHGAAIGAFHDALILALAPMGLGKALQPYSSATVEGDERSKQGDNAWGPIRAPRGHNRDWPTVVLEVAVSENQPKLQSDVRFWLRDGRGKVKIVFTLRVDRENQRIIIEKWVLMNERVHREAQVTVSRNKNGHVHVANAPLTIEFESLFLRNADAPREQDIEFSEADLVEMADTIWTAQGISK